MLGGTGVLEMNVVEAEAAQGEIRAKVRAEGVRAACQPIAECHPVFHDTDLEPLLGGLDSNPFQSQAVLACWLATFSGRGEARECYMMTLRNARGEVVLALPITRRKTAGFTRIELPHSGVIDFTAPSIRVRDAASLPAPLEIWALIREVLPPADIVVFSRLAPGGDTFENPLYALPQSMASRAISLRCKPLLAQAERHANLSKTFRKRARQNNKKFLELPGARIVVATTPEEALAFLSWMEIEQRGRIQAKGLEYSLDCPRVKEFYRRLIGRGVEKGPALVVGMMIGDDILAASFAILSGGEAIYLRVASDLEQHGAISPGLLVTDAAMDAAHARGVTNFDFGMGDYRYKRQLGGQPVPLRDLIAPLTAKGTVLATWLRLRHWASLNPTLRKLLGREALSQTE